MAGCALMFQYFVELQTHLHRVSDSRVNDDLLERSSEAARRAKTLVTDMPATTLARVVHCVWSATNQLLSDIGLSGVERPATLVVDAERINRMMDAVKALLDTTQIDSTEMKMVGSRDANQLHAARLLQLEAQVAHLQNLFMCTKEYLAGTPAAAAGVARAYFRFMLARVSTRDEMVTIAEKLAEIHV